MWRKNQVVLDGLRINSFDLLIVKENEIYHVPVLLEESLEALNIKADGVYVDVTFGGGGHSKAILERLGDKGRLIGFDQDADALENVLDDKRFQMAHSNYRYLKQFLRLYGHLQVDGILADLGVSSHQFDASERGFTFRQETPLDMRMNQNGSKSAIDILNTYSQVELQTLLSKYGEVRNARTVASAIVQGRSIRPIQTSGQLLQVLGPHIRGNRNRYLAQVFQALRIEVNDEVEALKALLQEAVQVLKPEGRLAVISYHSLEDRLVKRFFKTGNFEGVVEKDFYGAVIKPLKEIARKPITPSDKEIERNARARSAKMRVAEKLFIS